MNATIRAAAALVILTIFVCCICVFRRETTSDVTNLPDHWYPGPKAKNSIDYDTSQSINLKWVAKLGSEAFCEPAIAGGKIFIGTNNECPRNPKYVDVDVNGVNYTTDLGVMLCLNEADGKFLWQLTVRRLKAGKAND